MLQRYHEVQWSKVHMWQPAAKFNSHMASICTEPITYINSRVSEGEAYRRSKESKTPLYSNFPKIKQEVSAFGPKHAEHARRVYQAKGTLPPQKFSQIMVPPYRPNYDSMLVSLHRKSHGTKGSYLIAEHVHDRSGHQTTMYTDSFKGQVPVPITSKPYKTLLKVAKISSRPNEKQPKKRTGLKVPDHKVEQGLAMKPNLFQDSGCEIDLSNAPIFQILCEMSNCS